MTNQPKITTPNDESIPVYFGQRSPNERIIGSAKAVDGQLVVTFTDRHINDILEYGTQINTMSISSYTFSKENTDD